MLLIENSRARGPRATPTGLRRPHLLSIMLVLSASAPASLTPCCAAELPQDHAYQQTFREFMGTLKAEDFRINITPLNFERIEKIEDPEELYRIFIGFGGAQRLSFQSLAASPEHFSLAAIEAGDEPRCFGVPEAPTWWIGFRVPGNPFYNSDSARRRVAVMTMVNMMLADRLWSLDTTFQRADLLAHGVMIWAYIFPRIRKVLPEEVQAAFKVGLRKHLDDMIRRSPRDVNTNMDTRELVCLAFADKVFTDEEDHGQFIREARRMLFGRPDRTPATSDGVKGMFHPAGYIGEKDGPETSYNGISLYHLSEAAMSTRGKKGWDAFMPEVINRMVHFKALNTMPEPDGYWTGPSSWAKRTNAPYARDQRARSWRDIAAAMLSEHGKYLLRSLPTREELLTQLRSRIHHINVTSLKPSDAQPPAASKGVLKWPADIVYTYDDYVPVSFEKFHRLKAAGSSLLEPPFARGEDFNVLLDYEFWIAKKNNWGFQIETVADMGHGYNTGGTGALAGGSLAAFWTKEGGSFVLGRLPQKFSKVIWDDIEGWTTNHIWGRDAKGVPFSTARNWRIYPYYDRDSEPTRVFLRGVVGTTDSPLAMAPGCELDNLYYSRTFEKTGTGLRIASRLYTPVGEVTVGALWEALPVHLKAHKDQKPTEIALLAGGEWSSVPAGTAPGAEPAQPDIITDKVEAIRLTRFGHSVIVRLDHPRRVRVAGTIWAGAYQTRDHLRPLMIDLLEAKATPMELPDAVNISYTIEPEARGE